MKSTLACLRGLATLALTLCATTLWADGTLTHLSGAVSVQTSDGKIKPGMIGTKVAVGDTVVTGAGGYVRMEMTDGGEMVLRPDSQLKVEGYKFVAAKPAEDSFIFSMLRGGLRTVSGLIGKRGNQDAYELKTSTATIGIRGTQFDLRVCLANCGALPDGTYLAVRFGAVQTTNAQGSLAVAAGQVAHVPPQRPPVMLPRDPGIGFTPPAVIPKLDEKKKRQNAPAATQRQEGATATSAAKPAAEQKETKTAAKEEGKPKPEGQSQAPAETETAPAQSLATSAQPTGGQSCSVE